MQNFGEKKDKRRGPLVTFLPPPPGFCKQAEVQEQWPIWIVSYLGFPNLGQCESALSRFELTMFGYKGNRIPWNTLQKTKRAGLRPVCVVMMRIESPGKTKSGATIGSRFLRMDPCQTPVLKMVPGPSGM